MKRHVVGIVVSAFLFGVLLGIYLGWVGMIKGNLHNARLGRDYIEIKRYVIVNDSLIPQHPNP